MVKRVRLEQVLARQSQTDEDCRARTAGLTWIKIVLRLGADIVCILFFGESQYIGFSSACVEASTFGVQTVAMEENEQREGWE